jgi:hypothetical protein
VGGGRGEEREREERERGERERREREEREREEREERERVCAYMRAVRRQYYILFYFQLKMGFETERK